MTGVDLDRASGGNEVDQVSLIERDILLKTKLLIPPIHANHVARLHLINKLNGGLDKLLTLVSAPAGYGKTMLLAEWSAHSPVPVSWVALDESDNSPTRFLAYLIATLDKIQSNVSVNAQTLLKSSQPLPLPVVLTTLINDISAIPFSFVLILDDYQFIHNQSVHDTLAYILDHQPPNLHLVISTRGDPPLPLPRLRSRGQLVEIREKNLRFTSEEVDQYFKASTGLELSAEDVTALEERTEGWVVGLQTAALSIQGRDEPSSFIQSFSGSNRYILDYLKEEVLCRQSEDIQKFLMETSILDSLCGNLCDVVTCQAGSQELLERIEKANLFLIPLDEERQWYRYHHLFAELLTARLEHLYPQLVKGLHRRASEWYEEHGMIEIAMQHAFAAGDNERLSRLLEQNAFLMIMRGETTTLMEWLGKIPEELIYSRLELLRVKIWGLSFSGKIKLAEPQFKKVELLLNVQEWTPLTQNLSGEIALLRGIAANYYCEFSRSIDLCRRALELLPVNSQRMRAIAVITLGNVYYAIGDLNQARREFSKAGMMAEEFDDPWTMAQSKWELGFLDISAGKLHKAEERYQEAYRIMMERLGLRPGSVGMIDSGMAHLLIEWNQLDAANELLSKSLEKMSWRKPMRWWENPTVIVPSYTLQARLLRLRGDLAGAFEMIQKACQLILEYDMFPSMRYSVQAELILLWLAQGNPTFAQKWAEECKPGVAEQLLFREREQIARARVLFSVGKIVEAQMLLISLAGAAENHGCYGNLIEILILQALTLKSVMNTSQALQTLEKALLLAEPEGYMRVFLDEGQPMSELLDALGHQEGAVSKEYIARLLAAFPDYQHGRTLLEPITKREQEILRLIASGMSNQQIAEKLVLATGTVRAHTANIYRKLDVSNRIQAVVRAKELNLL